MDDDDFWDNTNPTDVSIDTVNSEEMMVGNHITIFYTPKQEEPVTTELLNKVSNVPEVTRKHGAYGGYNNQSDPQTSKSTDCKLNICKNESFSSDTTGNGDVARVMRKTFNIVEGLISDMLPKSSYLQGSTIVKDNNETTNGNEMGDLQPTAVDKNNKDSFERANTVLEADNILGAHVLEEKQEWFYQWADNYDVRNSDSHSTMNRIEMGGSHIFTSNIDVFNLIKTKHNGKSKTRIVGEVSTSNESDFYIGECQS